MSKHLSPYLTGFRKGYKTQDAVLNMLEKWKRVLDKKGYAGAIFLDLSKAFDTLEHDLLISKLNAYGFDNNSLKLIKNYLSNRWFRTKIETSFSSWSELTLGVPQGSVLGPLLFNIYLNDIFFIIDECDICNFADDTTLYCTNYKSEEVIKNLEKEGKIISDWFLNNYLKLNEAKSQFLIAGNKSCNYSISIGGSIIQENPDVKLLGMRN